MEKESDIEKISYSFAKSERLTSKIVIQEIFDKGTVHYKHPFKVFYRSNQLLYNRILITVPKRLHKRAVDRNLIKRRIREAYRLNKIILTNQAEISANPFFDINLVYTSGEILEFKQISNKLSDVLAKIEKSYNLDKKRAALVDNPSFSDSD